MRKEFSQVGEADKDANMMMETQAKCTLGAMGT